MNDHVTPPDRRLDRRIPLGCAASILLREGRSVAAECIELSVSGMTLHAAYVPGELEVIDVAVMSPGALRWWADRSLNGRRSGVALGVQRG